MLTKRKATVLVVLDTSGSMGGDKIQAATRATVAFLQRLHPDDVVGLFTFDDGVTRLAEPDRVGKVLEELSSRVNTLFANGNTSLYEAVCLATETMDGLRETGAAAGENRLYGIVLLSDGQDTIGHPSATQMFTTCLPAHAETDGVKIFPIAFGDDADEEVLKRIATVSGGKLFRADPDSIDQIYVSISAEQ
jgi:Ca-activated chloride channel family protein